MLDVSKTKELEELLLLFFPPAAGGDICPPLRDGLVVTVPDELEMLRRLATLLVEYIDNGDEGG